MRNSRATRDKRHLVNRTGIWTWQYDGESAALPRPLFGSTPASAVVGQWERENNLGQLSRFLVSAGVTFRRHGGKVMAMTMTFLLGATLASGPNSTAANWQLRERLRRADAKMNARQGELELVRMEIS